VLSYVAQATGRSERKGNKWTV